MEFLYPDNHFTTFMQGCEHFAQNATTMLQP